MAGAVWTKAGAVDDDAAVHAIVAAMSSPPIIADASATITPKAMEAASSELL